MFKIFSLCKSYLLKQLPRLIIMIFFSLFVTTTSLIFPYVSGNFIDMLLTSNDTNFIFKYMIITVVFGIIGIICGFISERAYIKMQTIAGYSLNAEVIRHVQKLPISFIKEQNMVYLNQQINNDSNSLIIFCINFLKSFISNFVLVVLPLYVIFMLSSSAVLIILINLALYCIGYHLFKKMVYKVNFQFKESQSIFFSKLHEQLANIEFIRTQGLLNKFITRLDYQFNFLLLKVLNLQVVNYSYSTYDKLLAMFSQITLMFVCGVQIVNGDLTIGEFTIILSYFTIISNSVRYYFSLGQSIQENLVSYTRLTNLLDIKQYSQGNTHLQMISKIELKNVSFSYDGNISVYKNYDIKFEKGKTYAILGPNGAGKSTLTNLVIGLFIDEFTGEILYNSKSIKSLNMLNILGKNIAVSEQEPFLLAETIRYNLTLADNFTVSEEKLQLLIELLGLTTFFTGLQDGLNTVINEDSTNLSGGEKQKLSLLRVLLKDSDVMILDEPTSALDDFGKNNLLNYLNKLKSNKIIIVVTHDRSFAENFDEKVYITHRNGMLPENL